MTNPAHPLPTSGGCYIRNPDGSLTREDDVDLASAPAAIPTAAPIEAPTAPAKKMKEA